MLLAYPLDLILSHYVKKPNQYYDEMEVWNDIYDSKASCDIAIYGSSRALVHFDPTIISDSLGKSTYNFGIDGQQFWLQYLRHKELIKFNKKPKLIIQSLDITSMTKPKGLYNLEQFLPYMLYNTDIYKFTSSYVGYNKYEYYIPLIRYAGMGNVLINIFRNKNSEKFRKKGYRGMDLKWNSDLDNEKKKIKKFEAILDKPSVELFETFIRECATSGIKLVFVYTPEYIEGQKFEANRSTIIKLYNNYAKKYNITLLDYSSDSICYNNQFFYNSMHLNKTGAELFSEKLAHDLKQLDILK